MRKRPLLVGPLVGTVRPSRSRRSPRFAELPVGLLTAALLLVGCAGGEGGPAAGAAENTSGVRARETTKVIAAPLERRDMVAVLETTAVLEAVRQVPVVARTSGQVVEIVAEEGDQVRTGQVLARLDDRSEALAVRDAAIAYEEAEHALASTEVAIQEAQSAIETAKNQLAQAERDLARDVELFSTSEGGVAAVSAKTLEQSRLTRDQGAQDLAQKKLALERATLERDRSRTALSRAAVTRDRAQLALDLMAVLAPFDGVVATRSIKDGQNLAGGAEAFVLTDPTELRVVFYRPQRELALFTARGTQDLGLSATTESLPGVEFEGAVERIAPVIDAASGSFRVTARMQRESRDDGKARLLPGMLLRLSIETDRHVDALVVEKRAVVREGEQAFIYLVADEDGQTVARRRFVRESFGDASHVEIVPLDELPLDETARVVVVGARDLSDGDPIVVLER